MFLFVSVVDDLDVVDFHVVVGGLDKFFDEVFFADFSLSFRVFDRLFCRLAVILCVFLVCRLEVHKYVDEFLFLVADVEVLVDLFA